MQHEDDVERLFSWLKTPDLRYRDFASEREVSDAVARRPTVQRTAEETALPASPAAAPATPVPPEPIAPPTEYPVRPGMVAGPAAVPAGERLMSALGRRVRAARGEPDEFAAESPRPAASESWTDTREAAEAERAGALQRVRAEQEARMAEQARALDEARAAAQARAADARAAAVNRARELAEQRAWEAAERETRAAAERRAAEVAAAASVADHPASPHHSPTPARPASARVFGQGERSSLFGGNYRGDRASGAGERRGRPLNAVFERLAEGEPAPEPGSDRAPGPPRFDRP